VPAPSDPADLRIGTGDEMSDAVTRSHLSDGRTVGWYGDAEVVIDAEIASAPVPPALAARHGVDRFWERWTAAECGAKASDVPLELWIREHGLSAGPVAVSTFRWLDLVVSLKI
jgi:hypothetical protein